MIKGQEARRATTVENYNNADVAWVTRFELEQRFGQSDDAKELVKGLTEKAESKPHPLVKKERIYRIPNAVIEGAAGPAFYHIKRTWFVAFALQFRGPASLAAPACNPEVSMRDRKVKEISTQGRLANKEAASLFYDVAQNWLG